MESSGGGVIGGGKSNGYRESITVGYICRSTESGTWE